ncbi:MAG: DUF6125 family protein, partial [Candidatus Bathyarchaeia archaeon]
MVYQKKIENDEKMLKRFSKEKLIDLFFYHIRNLWRVDGLYFLGIEEKFGTESATAIDANCWKIMGKLEARELKELLEVKQVDIPAVLYILQNTSWALYQTKKEIIIGENQGVFRVVECRTQLARLDKDLPEFPCKRVRLSYLQSFVETLNPNFEVVCKTCPPDP